MKLAFATGPNGEFSWNNRLPWGKPIKEDMYHFVNFTRGTKLVMGFNTWKSLPEKTKEKYHDAIIIFSRRDENYYSFTNNHRILCETIDQFVCRMNILYKFEQTSSDVEYCIIGGAQYIQASLGGQIPLTNILYTSIEPRNGSPLPYDKTVEVETLEQMAEKYELDVQVPYVTRDYNIVVSYYSNKQ